MSGLLYFVLLTWSSPTSDSAIIAPPMTRYDFLDSIVIFSTCMSVIILLAAAVTRKGGGVCVVTRPMVNPPPPRKETPP